MGSKFNWIFSKNSKNDKKLGDLWGAAGMLEGEYGQNIFYEMLKWFKKYFISKR